MTGHAAPSRHATTVHHQATVLHQTTNANFDITTWEEFLRWCRLDSWKKRRDATQIEPVNMDCDDENVKGESDTLEGYIAKFPMQSLTQTFLDQEMEQEYNLFLNGMLVPFNRMFFNSISFCLIVYVGLAWTNLGNNVFVLASFAGGLICFISCSITTYVAPKPFLAQYFSTMTTFTMLFVVVAAFYVTQIVVDVDNVGVLSAISFDLLDFVS
ncbi:hypothetical protein HDU97_000121 [Phlyctochytrium planicorne]|nr:hypothetical protein HDU97_000121 [Phlyctochytrium planicorne]